MSEKPIKILIISPYFFEPHRWMISAYKTALFLSKKHEVVVLTTGSKPFEQYNKNLKIYRMEDWFIPDPVNFSIVPGMLFRLLRVIRTEKPTHFVVNKNMFYTSLCIFWLRLLGKKVYTQVDTFPGINWFSRNKFVNLVLWLYSRTVGWLLLKMSTKVILLHEGLIPVAKSLGLKYRVIHNGVDFEQLESALPALDLAKRDKNEVRVIYVGRLESIKGYYDLVEAAKKITRDKKNVRFYLVGNLTGKDEYVKNNSSSQIVFLGHRNDIFSILKTMDIFVLPSYSEGLPNALMEAMAAGLACAASDVGGVKILLKDQETGLLFQPGNQKEIVEKIRQLIDDAKLRKSLGREARKLIAEKFDWDNIAKEIIRLLEDK